MIVAVIVIGPLLVAVHVNLNATVAVIDAVGRFDALGERIGLPTRTLCAVDGADQDHGGGHLHVHGHDMDHGHVNGIDYSRKIVALAK